MEFSRLDDIDLQLLRTLQEDASLSNVALAFAGMASALTCVEAEPAC